MIRRPPRCTLLPDTTLFRSKYSRVGREVRRLMLELTPLVEAVSIDEAFLDLTGTERLHHASPAVTLIRFADRKSTRLNSSHGNISYAVFCLIKQERDIADRS